MSERNNADPDGIDAPPDWPMPDDDYGCPSCGAGSGEDCASDCPEWDDGIIDSDEEGYWDRGGWW